MASADHLVIEATDPGALIDFPAFCQQAGHTLLSQQVIATPGYEVYRFEIIKG